MAKEEKWQKRVTILAVIVGVVLILAAVALGVKDGWLNGGKVALSEEFYGEFTDYSKLSAEKYEDLIERGETFIVFVDQSGCETADTLRGFVRDWATEAKVKVQKIMFSEMKGTSMHETVKYYPSVVVVEKGKIKAFLRADKDEDAEMYNNYDAFKGWIEKYI